MPLPRSQACWPVVASSVPVKSCASSSPVDCSNVPVRSSAAAHSAALADQVGTGALDPWQAADQMVAAAVGDDASRLGAGRSLGDHRRHRHGGDGTNGWRRVSTGVMSVERSRDVYGVLRVA